MFNLKAHLKTCSCGHTKGMYVDNSNAVVNGNGYSIAMGNGSIERAIHNVKEMTADWRQSVADVWGKHPTQIIAWARPHEGPANPHTKVDKTI